MGKPDKLLAWVGTTQSDMRAQPPAAQRYMGFQLRKVQKGMEPDNWKPMPSIGNGVREIRFKDEAGIYRTVYVLTGEPPVVFVLAVFTKKTQKTPQTVKDLAKRRYKSVMARREKGELP
ncbi:type II toxin-antitoxin system RelE/ParE family toxin [Mycolicibacter algericus]|uniref:type II toxin-antitoxin system RelE/ParE family toxin n=1 Tax=Mycolicibacter algericus TaxID=1288388 RepID=UPI003C76F5D4